MENTNESMIFNSNMLNSYFKNINNESIIINKEKLNEIKEENSSNQNNEIINNITIEHNEIVILFIISLF